MALANQIHLNVSVNILGVLYPATRGLDTSDQVPNLPLFPLVDYKPGG